MIEIRHLRTLQAIGHHGSLSRAAEELCVSQSALSHQLRDLESLLGVSLMNRRLQPVVFNQAGKQLLELAERVLPLVDAANAELRQMAAAPRPRLHIVLECHSCVDWLLPALTSFRRSWPAVELDLRIAGMFAPWPALLRAEIDMVITTDRVELRGVRFWPVFRSEIVLIVPHDHALGSKDFVVPEDLAGETLVSYPVPLERLDLHSRFLEPAGVRMGERRFAELTLMVGHLVACGQGVAALPSFALHGMGGIGLVARRLGEQGMFATLYAATREKDADRDYVRVFLETLRASCFETLSEITAP